MSSSVSAQRFAVVDVETSGLSVKRHNVLQIGVVVVNEIGRAHVELQSPC